MQKVRWGVLSTATIGTGQVIPAMQQGTYCEIAAIASRSPEKARAAAAQLGIPKAYGSYEELLADPEIDAIYNPLPNHLHVPWSIKALQAGKHVLCEKPIALTSAEGQTLVDVARQYPHLKVMEAFNAPANQPCKIWYQHGDETEEIQVEACNQYTLQGDAFSQAVLNNTGVPTPIEDAVANMKVIEAVFQSAKTATWVSSPSE